MGLIPIVLFDLDGLGFRYSGYTKSSILIGIFIRSADKRGRIGWGNSRVEIFGDGAYAVAAGLY